MKRFLLFLLVFSVFISQPYLQNSKTLGATDLPVNRFTGSNVPAGKYKNSLNNGLLLITEGTMAKWSTENYNYKEAIV